VSQADEPRKGPSAGVKEAETRISPHSIGFDGHRMPMYHNRFSLYIVLPGFADFLVI
jgi:hypothetical protein